MEKRGRRQHGIGSRKISVSVSEEDLKVISARAKRVHRGNVSAVVHEMVAALKREEALDELLQTLGGDRVTDAEMDSIRAEMLEPPVRVRKRRAAG